MSWVVKDVIDMAAHHSSDGERWTIVYEVDPNIWTGGTFHVSFPKAMVNEWAALYGYDLEDEAEVELLIEQILYTAYVNEMLVRSGRHDEVIVNPYDLDPAEAKQRIHGHIQEFKAKAPIVDNRNVRLMTLGAKSGSTVQGLDVVRSDLKSRLDKKKVADMTTKIRTVRKSRLGAAFNE
jgi:hypothetical protein